MRDSINYHFHQSRSQTTMLGATTFQVADPAHTFWGQSPSPPHSVAFLLLFFLILLSPSPSRSGSQVQLGGLGNVVSFPSEVQGGARPQMHFYIFWNKEVCLVATICVLFVGTKMSIWSFWTKMDVSSNCITWWDLLIQRGSHVRIIWPGAIRQCPSPLLRVLVKLLTIDQFAE